MKYMLLIYSETPNAAPPAGEVQAMNEEYAKFTQDIINEGIMQGGDALQSTETATTVRVRTGDVVTTDGPFAETKEQLGGFYLVDCRDLDHAIEVASRIPGAKWGSVEVRPVLEFE